MCDSVTGTLMERVIRIELTYQAWEARVLPLNYTRIRKVDHSESHCPLRQPLSTLGSKLNDGGFKLSLND